MRAIAWLGVLFLLTACGATSTASPNSVTPTPAATPSPTVEPTASASASPSVAPSPSSSPAPTASPSACQTLQGGTTSRAVLTDVRVGSHPGYDRLVVQFSGGLPAYKIVPQDPATFVGPASGQPVAVAGTYGFHLYIYQMDIPPTYPNGNLKPAYSVLQQVVVMSVFEGQADVAIGVSTAACPSVSVFSAPARLVIDFPTA